MTGIILHVRQGFEDDAAKELMDRLNQIEIGETIPMIAQTDSALVVARLSSSALAKARANLKFCDLVFPRQLLWSAGKVNLPNSGDRITPLIDYIRETLLPMSDCNAFSGVYFETPDTDSSKELSGFCKSLARPLETGLNKLRLLPKGKGASHLPRIHLVMLSNIEVAVALADVENASPWSMGIPRLKFPPQAPSRSTLKLEEAFHVFLGPDGIKQHLRSGMTGVDLGACPGGWTFQLVKHGIHTIAVDNGSIDSKLMSTGLVTHLREDAFSYRPHETVDWLVCDVVEQPSRITALMIDWIIHDYCHAMIFNLKLPMKKRYEETVNCLKQLEESCTRAGKSVQVRAKQLYHDRKEVTVYVSIIKA